MNKYLKYTLYALPVLAGGGFLFYYLRNDKNTKAQKADLLKKLQQLISDAKQPGASAQVVAAATAAQNQIQVINSTGSSSCGYPLKKGSKNVCVKQLQSALINAYGSGVLPKYGADGDWGNETEAAIVQMAHKNSISNSSDLNNTIMQMLADGHGLTYTTGTSVDSPYPDLFPGLN